ncbi:hypothetical protein RJ639_005050 [Escallonia herrerae]|uniref:AAA+ ATPase domain-containing protein n=1 Tax=Escallonia herrerae TaxID=1293975 RepID=A0AA88W3L9_9ASTE|nr:hypothetical protein RJ639_005050 [Escallonia herrerae]
MGKTGGEEGQLDQGKTEGATKQSWRKFRPKFLLSSTQVGSLYLLQKLDTLQYKEVPYSELLKGIKNGTVRRAQFEEAEGSSSRFPVVRKTLQDVFEDKPMVKFEDVEGVDAAKTELMEIVSCLKGDTRYKKVGAKVPRGVLLSGPPGTGKTLLARAMAGEAGVPFFSLLTEMDGFEVDKKMVVVIAATNRSEALDPALCRPGRFSRKVAVGEPDEQGRSKILAVHMRGVPLAEDKTRADLANIVNEAVLLAARGGGDGVSREDLISAIERTKTKDEMDGFEVDKKMVVVIAATSKQEALDPALCRPGRFSRKVAVGEPDEQGRSMILAVHMRGVPLAEDKTLICNAVASIAQGLVGLADEALIPIVVYQAYNAKQLTVNRLDMDYIKEGIFEEHVRTKK